jgi:hypothetical protein
LDGLKVQAGKKPVNSDLRIEGIEGIVGLLIEEFLN